MPGLDPPRSEPAREAAPRPATVEDRWILSRLQRVKADTAERIEGYDFSHAALGLYDFVYGELCDWYLELVKPRLASGLASAGAAARTARRSRRPCCTCCARPWRSRTR